MSHGELAVSYRSIGRFRGAVNVLRRPSTCVVYIQDRGLGVSQNIRGASKTDEGGHKKYSKMKCVIHLQCQKVG